MIYVWIALGSAIGGVARFWASSVIAARFAGDYPLGTVVVNLTGCFAIGLFAGLTAAAGRLPVTPGFRLFFMIGICGGYTTFSSFSLQTIDLARNGEWLIANLNVLLSVVGCLFAAWLGQACALMLNRR